MALFCTFMQSNQPHTFVVVTLDPPIRKGQTLYPHIVLQVFCWFQCITRILLLPCSHIFILAQFETDFVVHSDLTMSEDLLNTKYKEKLEPSYKVIYFICLFVSVFFFFLLALNC